jgi:GrpB-like predicted nucleotidyltransferase (UPF0157 family)
MPVHFQPEPPLRDVIELRRRTAFAELAALLPDAKLEHVGSTAVPGGWTSGILDVQVRVEKKQVAAAQAALAKRFTVEQEANGRGMAVMRDADGGVRIWLTAIGSESDDLREKRDLMREHPLLRERYDAVRRRHNRGDEAAYRDAKDRFWKVIMAP